MGGYCSSQKIFINWGISHPVKYTKRRFLHQWTGFLTVIGLLLLSVTGLILNYPDYFKPQSIMASVSVNGVLYSLQSGQLIAKAGDQTFSPIFPGHQIAMGDQLVSHPKGVGILHRDGVLMVYEDGLWNRIILPEGWPEGIHIQDPSQWVLRTSTAVYTSADQGVTWDVAVGPYSESFYSQVKRMHSGHFFGKWGSVWINMTAILIVILSVTGLLLLRFKSFKKRL